MLANLLYLTGLIFLSPIVLYRMIRHGRYRRGVAEKLLGLSREKAESMVAGRDCIWIHAVSVGEVNLLPGLVSRLQRKFADCAIVVSSSTDTGYDLAVKHFGANHVFFCPLDFTWAVDRTLRSLHPRMLVLAELELWPNLIQSAHQQHCDVVVINARLSARSALRYQRFGRLTRPIFAQLCWVGCQDSQCRDRFAACGTPDNRLQVTGSVKFDDAPTLRDTPEVQACVQWAGIDPWHRVWVMGSTQEGEERLAIETYQALRRDHPDLRLILVPRHRERFQSVADLITASGLSVHRRSRDQSMFDLNWNNDTVILVDTIGELRHWWGVCQIATVGGSFGDRGGQNMLEPAGYGCALAFGPDTRNFATIAQRLIDAGGAVRVHNQQELQGFVKRCLVEIPVADALGQMARDVVLQHRGATDRTIDAIAGHQDRRHAA